MSIHINKELKLRDEYVKMRCFLYFLNGNKGL